MVQYETPDLDPGVANHKGDTRVEAFSDELHEEPPMMSKWNPIDTAPRDGTLVLALYNDTGGPPTLAIVAWHNYLGGTYRMAWRDDRGHVYREPTHWITLPSLPEAA